MFGSKSADAAWIEACAEADHLDPGWRWEDLLARRPQLVSDRDANQVLAAAAARLPPKWFDWSTVLHDLDLLPQEPDLDSDDFERELDLHYNRVEDAGREIENEIAEIPRNQVLSSNAALALRAAMSKAAAAHCLARQSPELEIGRYFGGERPIMLHLPTNFAMRIRSVATLLQLHAMLAAEEGGIDDALADGRAMLAVAEAAAEPPMLITVLVAFAIRNLATASMERTLAQGELSDSALETTQRRVWSAYGGSLLLEGLRGERALTDDVVRAFEQGRVTRWQLAKFDCLDVIVLSRWRRFCRVVWTAYCRRFSKRQAGETVRYYTALVELLKQSREATDGSPDRMDQIRRTTREAVLHSQQGAESMFVADRQQRAKLVSLACALACERFRCSTGRWPDSLDNLVPSYLISVPVDPYDSRPLRYRRLADGVVIYALGPDGKDSGGDIHVPRYTPPDIGIRLWNPEFRHRSPPAR